MASISSGVGRSLQRLFSTFPDGRPGLGLLLVRFGVAIPVIYLGIAGLSSAGQSLTLALLLVAVAGGILLLAGLWTPIAGMIVAIDELWTAFSQPSVQWIHILLAVLAVGVAMLGPGGFSIDARLFGRQRFEMNGGKRRR